jgi:hypothetical protein
MPVDECATLVAQYGPFDKPVEDSAILDPDYVRAIDASRHQLAPSDTDCFVGPHQPQVFNQSACQ